MPHGAAARAQTEKRSRLRGNPTEGDKHEICNTGKEALRTLNVYVPPAYTDDSDELPVGRA